MKKLQDLTEPQLRDLMSAMAKSVEGIALIQNVEKPMFTLLLWNDPKIGQYICNCDRRDVIKALRETADRLERRHDVTR